MTLYPSPRTEHTAGDCDKLSAARDVTKTALPKLHISRAFSKNLYTTDRRRSIRMFPASLVKVKCDIEKGSGAVRVPQRHIRPQRIAALPQHCFAVETMNSIQRSTCAFSAAPVIVPKPHANKTEFPTCLDYLAVNLNRRRDIFPLPRCK